MPDATASPDPGVSARQVDADSPWLGLLPFTEETQRFFFGRDAEIREIFLRVRDQALTVLYGQSGYGKTSLLNAGLIPKLRADGFRPVLLRLRFEKDDPPSLEQVRAALVGACADETTLNEVLFARWGTATLWECFHHRALRPDRLAAAPLVILFDQFEEIFTLGAAQRPRSEIEALATELADLIENRPPASVQARLADDLALADELDFGPSPLRLIITLREDFLSYLEAWKGAMPSLMRNRMALQLLRGSQAWEAVVRPGRLDGRNLLSDEVGAQIVRVIARRAPGTPLEEIEAVPPLLSLLCDELNRARDGAPEITAQLVEQRHGDILHDFYARCFDGFPPAVRRFVEDRLVTVGGHRNLAAREDAEAELVRSGVPEPTDVLDKLLARRLLSAEERGGTQRIEITHDVLAPLVTESRDKRQGRERADKAEVERKAAQEKAERAAREERRLRRFAIAAGIAAVLAILGMIAGWVGMKLAEKAKDRAQRATQEAAANLNETRISRSGFLADLARRKLNEGHVGVAVALARLAVPTEIPDWPKVPSAENALALAVQTYSSSPIRQIVGFVGHEGTVRGVRFSPDESRVLSWSYDGTARLWETESGKQIAVLQHDAGVRGAVYTSDRILTWSFDGTARLWDKNGQPIAVLEHNDVLGGASFSTDKKRVLTWSYDGTARLWNSIDGKAVSVMNQKSAVSDAQFLSQEKLVLTWSSTPTAHVWNADTGEEVVALRHDKDICGALVLSDQNRILTWSDDGSVRLWDTAGKQLLRLDLEAKAGASVTARLSEDQTRLLAWNDTTVRVWNISEAKEERQFQHSSAVVRATLASDNSKLLTRCRDNSIRLWELSSGKQLNHLQEQANISVAPWWPEKDAVITICDDGSARIWLTAKNGEWSPAQIGASRIRDVQFNSESSIRVLSDDGAMRWFSLGNLQHEYALVRHRGEMLDWTFSQKGDRLLTASADGSARLWDLNPNRFIELRQDEKVLGVKFSKDSGKVLTWSSDGTVCLWEEATGNRLFAIQHAGQVAGWSDDERIIVASSERAITALASDNGKQVAEIDVRSKPLRVLLTPNGDKIAAVFEDGTASVWNGRTGRTIADLKNAGNINQAIFSSDGKQMVTCSTDNNARVWDASSGALLHTFTHDALTETVLSPDGSRLIALSRSGSAILWDMRSAKEVGRLRHGGALLSASFSADSSRLVTRADEDAVRLWDPINGKEISVITSSDAQIYEASFSADSSRLLVGAVNGLVRLFNSKDGTEVARVYGPNGRLSLSTDGTRVIGVGLEPDSSQSVSVWDGTTSELVANVSGLAFADRAAFAADAKHVATWNNVSALVQLWPVWAPKEQLLDRASQITARLQPLSPIDRAMAHLNTANPAATERISEQELAMKGDALHRHRWKIDDTTGPINLPSYSDADTKVQLVVNERNEAFVFHNRPWSRPVVRLEYNRLTRSMEFLLKGGVRRNFGMLVDQRLGKYLEKSTRILMVLMDDKTGEPIEGSYSPLLVY